MPRPVYILCAMHGINDSTTGLTSLINIIERIEVPKDGNEGLIARQTPFFVVAAWEKEDEDDGKRPIECMITIQVPGHGVEPIVSSGTILFDSRMMKVFSEINQPLPIYDTGFVLIDAKLRKIGSGDWIANQQYRIEVARAELEKPSSGGK